MERLVRSRKRKTRNKKESNKVKEGAKGTAR
jgi:hypothetical protein